MIGYLVYFNYAKSDDFINSPYNTRQDTFSDRVVRGKIISADEQVLAQTNVYEDGTEERTYPYANMFAHVVGYDTNGKSVKDMLRKPYFVPETIKADQLFSDMQKNKIHISIVIDEYGETRGIVTLEDLLEEIVGNIYDEYDKAESPEIEKIDENKWKVQGTLSIDDLNDELDINIPDDRDYDTVGGMIF